MYVVIVVRVARLTATRTTTFASRAMTPTLMSPMEPKEGKIVRSVSPMTVRYVTTATPTRIPDAAPHLVAKLFAAVGRIENVDDSHDHRGEHDPRYGPEE